MGVSLCIFHRVNLLSQQVLSFMDGVGLQEGVGENPDN